MEQFNERKTNTSWRNMIIRIINFSIISSLSYITSRTANSNEPNTNAKIIQLGLIIPKIRNNQYITITKIPNTASEVRENTMRSQSHTDVATVKRRV